MAENTTTAPPLTVDNVLTAVQGVDWKRLGKALFPSILTRSKPVDGFMHVALFDKSYPKLDEIEQKYDSDDARLHTVVKTWMLGGGVDEEPSWRHLIWRLDSHSIAGVADNIRHFAEPVLDPTLSAENVMEVMGEVGAWERVAQGDGLRRGLNVPNSKLQETMQQSSSEREKSRAMGEYWVNTDPDASWKKLAVALYEAGEDRAAAMAKQYLPEVPTLTVENVTEVLVEVADWEEVAKGDAFFRRGLGIPNSKLQEIKKKSSIEREKRHLLGEYWVNTDPDASWERLAVALYDDGEERAAAMTKQYLPKADPTLTTDNLMEVLREVEHRWDDVRFKFGVPYSKREEIQRLYHSDSQKMEAIITYYVRSPIASWKVVAETLKKMKLHKQADDITAKYVKDITGRPERGQVEHNSDLVFMERVGAGQYGVVSKGRWISKDKIVAIKMLIDFNEREAGIISSLDHPCIIQCFGVVEEKNLHYIVTEFAENGSIYDYIHKEHKQPSLDQRLLWAKEVVEGMIYLHHRDIIHRDLKSSNVLVTAELKAKICDLGSARRLAQTAKQTTAIGTYAWMAPEMMKGSPVSKACDVYSFGIFLWELVTLQQPFSDVFPQFLVMNEVMEGKRPSVPKTCVRYLANLLNRCWQMEAKARPSFEEISMILNEDTPPSGATSQQSTMITSKEIPPSDAACQQSSSGDITHDTKPRIAQLMRLKTSKGEMVEIVKTIAPDWKQFGLLLDLDPKGKVVKRIEAAYAQSGSVICCQEMFMLWLDSADATWGNLIELLIDTEQEELAEQVKSVLSL